MLTNQAHKVDSTVSERVSHRFTVPLQSVADPDQKLSSEAFRIGGVYERVSTDGRKIYLIDLYRRDAIVSGRCYRDQLDRIPAMDSAVLVTGKYRKSETGLFLIIHELVSVGLGECDLNPFDVIIPHWDRTDGSVVARASAVWESMPSPYRETLSLILDKHGLLRRYLNAPGSINGHHAITGGCLAHSVEMAEMASHCANTWKTIDLGLLTLACFLHDIGKCYEYELHNDRWRRSSKFGTLFNHNRAGPLIVLSSIGDSQLMSGMQRLSLLHALTAGYGKGDQYPATPEAEALMKLDQLSASNNLTMALLTDDGSSWTRHHPHKSVQSLVMTRLPSV